RPSSDLIGQAIGSILLLDIEPVDAATIGQLVGESHEGELLDGDGGRLPVLVATSELADDRGGLVGAVFAATDISERRRLELELRHAQRLESIGELAAGVAHEINTPIQYVSDGVRFVGETVDDLLKLLAVHEPLVELATGMDGAADTLATIASTEAELELSFLQDEAPRAVTRVLDGVERVVTIVQALKQFSHPGSDELAPVDLNTIIENALTVARNEYKYVAEIDLQLGDIPTVDGDAGDLGQALLNLIVNASHAIADVQAGADQSGLGRITITTWSDDEAVMVDVTDTGGGIPAEIQDRVFEPFFTTKEVGKGTGQGLAITRNQVVKKHGGRIEFEVDDGVGTTFHIWLPTKKEV
ncbi:MAG: ATP-binding protein, partial [Actinomycetota bacterium]